MNAAIIATEIFNDFALARLMSLCRLFRSALGFLNASICWNVFPLSEF